MRRSLDPPNPCHCSAVALAIAILAVSPARCEPKIIDCEIGFAGSYKLGHWTPVFVKVDGADGAPVRVVAPDCDGAAVVTEVNSGSTSEGATHRGLIRVGRRDASITVRLKDPGGAELQRTFVPSDEPGSGFVPQAMASTDRLLVELTGSDNRILLPPDDGRPSTIAKVSSLAELPTRWMGYEGVECLVVSCTEPLATGEADALAVRAIADWVESGGRLVLIGAKSAEQIVGSNGPLAGLLPGRFDKILTLTDGSPLESFAGSEDPVGGGQRLAIPVARLKDVKGTIEAHAGGRPSDLPLVIRQRRGLGEVTFVAVDLSDGPLADWDATPTLVAKACRLAGEQGPQRTGGSGALIDSGYNDLAGALQHRLGRNFTGVSTTPMLAIVAAILLYIALIGPVDYFVLRRWLGSMEATWLTFPLVVVLLSGGAYWLAGQQRGNAPRLNRIALVDVDAPSRRASGVIWAQAYSPRATRHDVTLAANWIDGSSLPGANGYTSWLGLPGSGLGGLQRTTGAFMPTGAEYRQAEELRSLVGLPINAGSTKALTARWLFDAPEIVESDLSSPVAGVLRGSVVNATGAALDRCWIVHREWAWRIGRLDAGAAVTMEAGRAPVKLTTLVSRDYVQPTAERSERKNTRRYDVKQADVETLDAEGLLHLMMFTEALGGPSFTGLPNDFQPFTDASVALEQDRAVLVARVAAEVAGHRSELLSGGKQWAPAGESDRVFCRFVLPVAYDR